MTKKQQQNQTKNVMKALSSNGETETLVGTVTDSQTQTDGDDEMAPNVLEMWWLITGRLQRLAFKRKSAGLMLNWLKEIKARGRADV